MRERMRALRKQLGLTQTEFGERLGVTVTAISKIEVGTNPLTDQMVKSMCSIFKVSRAWLENGIGEMFVSADQESIALVENLMEGENETAKALFSALARLSDAEWETVEKLLDMVEEARGHRSSSS